MRTLPIPLAYHRSPSHVLTSLATRASQVTHPHKVNSEACSIYTLLVAQVLSSNATKQDLFATLASFNFTDEDLSSRFGKFQTLEDITEKPVEEISSSGHVVDTIEAALWVFFGR